MVQDPCLAAGSAVICNRFDFQSPAMQKWLLLQLLNAMLTSPQELSALKEAAQSYICQGSPAKIDAIIAAGIAANLPRVNLAQPVCWTPLELEGALAYVLCKLADQLLNQIL